MVNINKILNRGIIPKPASFSEISSAVCFFSQAISLQILFYPLIFFNYIKYPNKILKNWRICCCSLIVISAMVVSLLFRGASFLLTIKITQFYGGILLVVCSLLSNRQFKLMRWHLYCFTGLILIEFFMSNIFHINPYSFFRDFDFDFFSRAHIGNGIYRAYGAALNSSVSGSIAIVIFFFVLNKKKEIVTLKTAFFNNVGKKKQETNFIILILALFSFVFCASGSAFIVFLFLFMILFLKFTFIRILKSRILKSTFTKMVLFLGVVIAICVFLFLYTDLFESIGKSKIDINYLKYLINLKFMSIKAFDTNSFLFGSDLSRVLIGQIGGDFVLFDAIRKLGLLIVGLIIVLLVLICKKKNRWFLLAGIISSLHYGTIFTLTGQLFFGALIADSIYIQKYTKVKRRQTPSIQKLFYRP